MNLCSNYCDLILEELSSHSSEMKVVLAHESYIKEVPLNETIAAVGIKKCVISDMPDEKTDENVKVQTKVRTILVTVGINFYVPYEKGTRGCVSAFDKVFSTLIGSNEYSLCEAKLLGTKYSRETQSLIAETEFVFESFYSGLIEGPPYIESGK